MSINKKNEKMENLRQSYYDQIEVLELKLQGFDSDQYGSAVAQEAVEIGAQIDELETKISETWSN
jgi:hypothetical protein